MLIHNDETQSSSAGEQPPSPILSKADQVLRDIQAVNAQLLINGLQDAALANHLRHQLAFITAITTSLSEGVFVLDSAGLCTYVNPAAEIMLGWTGDELHGQHIGVVVPVQIQQRTSIDTVPSPVLDVLRSGTIHRDENALFVHRNGGRFPTAYSAAPIITDGLIVGAVITFRDTTEVRRLQRLREEYLALISHDLRAPLTMILGRAEILLQQLMQQGLEREAKSAKIIIDSGLRMNQMIENLSESSDTNANVDLRQWPVIDLVVIMKQMLDQTIAHNDVARITLDTIPSLSVAADIAQIERVIVNLLVNALKFSSHNTPITVQIYQQATNALIVIKDQGIGITPEDLRHVFEKHYRAQTAGLIAGNGLGLYSSRLIIEAYGGRLWGESMIGVGSSFTVALPLPA